MPVKSTNFKRFLDLSPSSVENQIYHKPFVFICQEGCADVSSSQASLLLDGKNRELGNCFSIPKLWVPDDYVSSCFGCGIEFIFIKNKRHQ